MLVSLPLPRGSAALIGALAVASLFGIAFAVPPARLEPQVTDVQRGLLVSHSRFSDQLAEQINADGYNYLAIDLTHAPMNDKEIWVKEFKKVGKIYTIWGWIDAREGIENAKRISVKLNGLFVFEPTGQQLTELKNAARGMPVVPIMRGQGPTVGGVAMNAADFAAKANDTGFPVLLAGGLDMARIRAARDAADGSYLVVTTID